MLKIIFSYYWSRIAMSLKHIMTISALFFLLNAMAALLHGSWQRRSFESTGEQIVPNCRNLSLSSLNRQLTKNGLHRFKARERYVSLLVCCSLSFSSISSSPVTPALPIVHPCCLLSTMTKLLCYPLSCRWWKGTRRRKKCMKENWSESVSLHCKRRKKNRAEKRGCSHFL